MRIAVLANLEDNAPAWDGMSPDQWDDLDSQETIDDLVNVLTASGHTAQFFEANINPPFNLIENLRAFQPDLCFNIAEGHFGDSRESHIPSVLEMLRIPYTGSQVLSLALTLDKPMLKRVLCHHGLPTPAFQVFTRADVPFSPMLLDASGEPRFPLFVKPAREGTSMGITTANIVWTEAELREQVRQQLERYKQPILCEQYLGGREVTVGMVGNLTASLPHERARHESLPADMTVFPVLEINLHEYDSSEGRLYTNRMKTVLGHDFRYTCPAELTPELTAELQHLAVTVYAISDCRDMGRVDFRFDEANRPYILEVNPLPGLTRNYSDLCLQAAAHGWTYEDLIQAIVSAAAQRYQLEG